MKKLDTLDKIILSLTVTNMVLSVVHDFWSFGIIMKLFGILAVIAYIITGSKLWLDEKPEDNNSN